MSLPPKTQSRASCGRLLFADDMLLYEFCQHDANWKQVDTYCKNIEFRLIKATLLPFSTKSSCFIPEFRGFSKTKHKDFWCVLLSLTIKWLPSLSRIYWPLGLLFMSLKSRTHSVVQCFPCTHGVFVLSRGNHRNANTRRVHLLFQPANETRKTQRNKPSASRSAFFSCLY